jgi:hypothetical protein
MNKAKGKNCVFELLSLGDEERQASISFGRAFDTYSRQQSWNPPIRGDAGEARETRASSVLESGRYQQETPFQRRHRGRVLWLVARLVLQVTVNVVPLVLRNMKFDTALVPMQVEV